MAKKTVRWKGIMYYKNSEYLAQEVMEYAGNMAKKYGRMHSFTPEVVEELTGDLILKCYTHVFTKAINGDASNYFHTVCVRHIARLFQNRRDLRRLGADGTIGSYEEFMENKLKGDTND